MTIDSNNMKKITILAFAITVLFVIVKTVNNSHYRNRIPDIPDLSALNTNLQNQIRDADQDAHKKPTVNNLGILGTVYHSSLYYEQAEECYKLAIKKNPSKWIWSYYLGCIYKELGKPEDAVENFVRVLKKNPEAFHAQYYIGEGYRDLGMNDKAISAFGEIAWKNGEFDKGSKNFRNDYFSLDIYAKYQIARIHYVNSDFEASQKELVKIMDQNSAYGPALRLLGSIFNASGDTITGNEYLTRSMELFHLTTPVDTLLDILAFRSTSEAYILKQIDKADYDSDFEWAVTLANNALKYTPDNKYAISKAVKLFLRTEFGLRALSLLDKHYKDFSEDFTELKDVADLLYRNHFYTEAYNYYEKASELHPEDTGLQANMALSLLGQGEKDKVKDLINLYVKKNPANPDILSNAVYISFLMDEVTTSECYLGRLMSISPSSSKGLLLSGLLKEKEGNLTEAQSLYEKSQKIDPELITIESLGNLLVIQKKYQEAIGHFSLALEVFPNEPFILRQLGSLLVNNSDTASLNYKKGIQYLERVLFHRSCPYEYLSSTAADLSAIYAKTGINKKAKAYDELVTGLRQAETSPRDLIIKLMKQLK